MNIHSPYYLLLVGSLVNHSVLANAIDSREASIEHLTIFGDTTEINDVPGSAHRFIQE